MPVPTFFPNAKFFRQWLEANAASATELIVGFHKVGTGQPSMSWSESVDEALCVGWIDGVRRRIDESAYSIRFTPRKPASIWSAINIAKVEELQIEGRMTIAGVEAFSRRTQAKSGVYSHEQAETAELSSAELRAFHGNTQAWSFYENTPPGYKKVVLHWINSAKKTDTRAARFNKLLEASAAGKRLS